MVGSYEYPAASGNDGHGVLPLVGPQRHDGLRSAGCGGAQDGAGSGVGYDTRHVWKQPGLGDERSMRTFVATVPSASRSTCGPIVTIASTARRPSAPTTSRHGNVVDIGSVPDDTYRQGLVELRASTQSGGSALATAPLVSIGCTTAASGS